MSWGQVGGAIGGSLLGGYLQNRGNRREAEKNRGWQAYMSNTSHQREVKDLIAAGLNPIISATGGATTPSGAQSQQENVAQGAVSSALEAKRVGLQATKQAEEIELIKSQKGKNNMETRVLQKGLPEAEIKNLMMDKLRPLLTGKKLESMSSSAKEAGRNIKELWNKQFEGHKSLKKGTKQFRKHLNRKRSHPLLQRKY